MMLIGLVGLALIILVAALAVADARRYQAARPPDAPLDMPQRAARQARPTGLTIIVKKIAERTEGEK